METHNSNDVLTMLFNRFGDTAFKNKDRTIDEAWNLAYADMSRRAGGHKIEINKRPSIIFLTDGTIPTEKIPDDFPNDFIPFLKVITDKKKFDKQKDFDEWHEDCCKGLRAAMTSADFKGKYGRAQKVINMAFKYLMYTDPEYIGAQEFCHMTLDSYTLAWYRSDVNPKEKSIEWSKLDDYGKYLDIQDKIRTYLATDQNYSIHIPVMGDFTIEHLPKEPIRAEFIIWEGEKLREKYTDLVKDIKSYYKEGEEGGKEKDSWLINDSFSDFLKKEINK